KAPDGVSALSGAADLFGVAPVAVLVQIPLLRWIALRAASQTRQYGFPATLDHRRRLFPCLGPEHRCQHSNGSYGPRYARPARDLLDAGQHVLETPCDAGGEKDGAADEGPLRPCREQAPDPVEDEHQN